LKGELKRGRKSRDVPTTIKSDLEFGLEKRGRKKKRERKGKKEGKRK